MGREEFLEKYRFGGGTVLYPDYGEIRTDGKGKVNNIIKNGDVEYFEAAYDVENAYDSIDLMLSSRIPIDYCKKNRIGYVDFSEQDSNTEPSFMVLKACYAGKNGNGTFSPVPSASLARYLYSSKEAYLEGELPQLIQYQGTNFKSNLFSLKDGAYIDNSSVQQDGGDGYTYETKTLQEIQEFLTQEMHIQPGLSSRTNEAIRTTLPSQGR